MTLRHLSLRALAIVLGLIGSSTGLSGTSRAAERTLSLTTSTAMTIDNPYGDSSTELYSIWCQTYGCLGRYNFATKTYEGLLAQKWENLDPNTWRFTLRTDLRRQDGGPGVTSRDVVHSWKRILTDPASVQRFIFDEVKEIVAVDDHTFEIRTKRPVAQMVGNLFDIFAITSADLYEHYGKDADRKAPYGWGPYKLKEFVVDQRIVLDRNEQWPGLPAEAPATVVYRLMREPEQRLNALFANEVQIARSLPPQLMDRLKNRPDIKVATTGSIELMFLAMNPSFKPWDDVRVRRAAAFALNRDAIISRLLFGYADRLDGPIGPNQVCYTGPAKATIGYDPQKAKALLAEAGYGSGGPEVDLYTANGRYTSDRQIAEAIAQMLRQVGFKVQLHAPEWANLWADIRAGKSPFYYMGRGSVVDPGQPLSQLFETGVTNRIKYSNPALDTLFSQERATFEPAARCPLVQKELETLAEDVPADFLWTHRLINAYRSGVEWAPDASGTMWLAGIKMRGASL